MLLSDHRRGRGSLSLVARLLSATALGGALLALASSESAAQQAPACAAAQFSGTAPNGTVDLKGASCTLPQAAYPTAATSSGTTITNSVASPGILYQGTAGVTEVFAGRVIDGAGTTGIGLVAGTLQVNQSPTTGYANTYSGQTLVQGGTLITTAPNVSSPNTTVVISSGGVFDLGGYAQTVQAVTLQGGTVQNGALTGNITATAGGVINTIAGPTSVTNTGGTTTLQGTNGYTGSTTVGGGALSVASGASITQSSLLNVSAGTFTNVGTATFAGVATVASGATLTNSGTMSVGTLNNAGTVNFSGPTFNISNGINNTGTINRIGGSFFVSGNNGNGFINNTGTINSNFTNGLNANGTGVIANNNAGGFVNGTLTANKNVTNNNAGATWTGDAVVNAGGTVTNAGTFTTTSAGFSNAGTFTTSGVLNVINGGLTNSGTLNASGTITGVVTNTGAFSLKGPLSGITTFNQQAGTLDLGGSTLTTPTLALSGGTVQNGSLTGSILSAGGNITNVTATGMLATTGGSTVVSPNYGFMGIFVGAGSSATFSQGLVSNFMTAGAGTINANVVANGVFAPGSSSAFAPGSSSAPGVLDGPGTLTINGALTVGPTSTFKVIVTPTQASSVAVNGAASVNGGTVSVLPVANTSFTAATTYKILSATQGVTGTFGSVQTQTNYAFLTPTLSYDANDAYLTLNPNGTQLTQVATTPNTGSVASALTRSGQGSQLLGAFSMLSAPQAQAAANSISGEGNVSTQTAGQAATRTFTNFIGDRSSPGETNAGGVQVSVPAGTTQYAATEQRPSPIVVASAPVTPLYRVFATGFGGASNTAGVGDAVAGSTGSFYGGLMGIDYRVRPDLLIGAAAGGSNSNFLVAARGSSGSTTGFNGNVFSVVSFGQFYGQSLTTLSSYSNSTTRNIAGFGGLPSAVEKANFGSFEVRTRAEFGRVIPIEAYAEQKLKITPFVALELAQLTTNGYSEYNATGGGNIFGLSTNGRTYADVRSFLGARFETSYDVGQGIVVRPIVRLAYVHAFSPAPSLVNTFQSVPGATFVVNGSSVAHNSAETKLGAEVSLGHGTVIFANFEGNFSTIEQIYGGRAGVRYSW